MYKIRKLDEQAVENAEKKWNSIAKPLHSLGVFEDIVKNIAGIQGTQNIDIKKRCVLVMCADNGVVCEGVTQTGQEVTAVVTENFAKGATSVCAMARNIGADVVPIDVGVARDVDGVVNKKISYGTKNMLHEKAMTYEQAKEAVQVGIDCVKELSEKGYKIIVTGEMGIGNTSSSSLWMTCFTGIPLDQCVGAGSGLNHQGINHKYEVLKRSLEQYPGEHSAEEILCRFGGYEMVMAVGAMLKAAELGMVILIDGFIMTNCILAASRLYPEVMSYAIFGHQGDESGHKLLLDYLGARPLLNLGLRLGEGSGSVCAYPIVDSAVKMLNEMDSFAHASITKYF